MLSEQVAVVRVVEVVGAVSGRRTDTRGGMRLYHIVHD